MTQRDIAEQEKAVSTTRTVFWRHVVAAKSTACSDYSTYPLHRILPFLMSNRLVLLFALLVASGFNLGGSCSFSANAVSPLGPPATVRNSEIRLLPPLPNGRQHQLRIALPGSYYTHPERRYPVAYFCDGYWDLPMLAAFEGMMVYDRTAPEYIVVGFDYAGTDLDYDALRMYDYTPGPDVAHGFDATHSGHAAEFLDLIEHRIIPLMDSEYRTIPEQRVLGGSSAGGLFTLYAMFSRPALFQGYVASSPGVVWGDEAILRYEAEFAAKHTTLPVRLFLSEAGDEWPELRAGIQSFRDRLYQRGYSGLVLQWRTIEGERHAGTKAESYYRGLRFAFGYTADRTEFPFKVVDRP